MAPPVPNKIVIRKLRHPWLGSVKRVTCYFGSRNRQVVALGRPDGPTVAQLIEHCRVAHGLRLPPVSADEPVEDLLTIGMDWVEDPPTLPTQAEQLPF